MKFWRSDNKGGKSYWMDIGETRILLMNSIPYSTTSSTTQAPTQVRTSSSAGMSSNRGSTSMKIGSQEDRNENRSKPKSKAKPINDDSEDEDERNHQEATTAPNTGMTDTYVSCQSLQAALCASGIACR
jgi:hypothetical protein